jgi:ketosteroid isomerase-like protein
VAVAETTGRVTDEELALVRRGYGLWNAGDFEGVARLCFAEDIVWQNAPEWPGTRTYQGQDEVIEFLREEVASVIELGDIEIESLDVYGDEVVIRMLARTRGAGSELDIGKIPIFHVARIRAGRVARVRVYLDHSEALAATQASYS